MILSTSALAYNQLANTSQMPLRMWGLSAGLGLAGNGFGIKPQITVGRSLALIMPLTVSYIPLMNIFKRTINIARLHGGIGLRWHIMERIDRSSYYLEPAVNLGETRVFQENYLALKPALSFGHSWVSERGFIFSLGLSAQYEFLWGPPKERLKDIRQSIWQRWVLLNQPLGAEISFGFLF